MTIEKKAGILRYEKMCFIISMESQLDICKTDIILYVKFTFRLVGDVI